MRIDGFFLYFLKTSIVAVPFVPLHFFSLDEMDTPVAPVQIYPVQNDAKETAEVAALILKCIHCALDDAPRPANEGGVLSKTEAKVVIQWLDKTDASQW